MDSVFDCIHQRRSVRAYRPEQISEDELQAILEAGRAAPSGGNSRTAHLLVIQNAEVLQKLRALVEAEFAQMEADEHTYQSIRNSIAASKKGGYEFFFRAPTLVVVSNRIGYGNAMAVVLAVIIWPADSSPRSMASLTSKAVITLVMLAGYIFSWAFWA